VSTNYLDKLQTCDPPSLLFHGYRNPFPGVKQQGLDSGHSRRSSAEVKNECNYTFTLPVCPHIVGRDNFICLPDVRLRSPSTAFRLVEEPTVDICIMRNELVLTYLTIRCHIPKYRQSDFKKPQQWSEVKWSEVQRREVGKNETLQKKNQQTNSLWGMCVNTRSSASCDNWIPTLLLARGPYAWVDFSTKDAQGTDYYWHIW